MLKRFAKRVIIGTPLEGTIRRMWETVGPRFHDPNDYATLAVMKKVLLPISNGIDIGCHKGAILRVMLELAPHGRHMAFEPIEYLYTELSKKFADVPSLELYRCALSDQEGDAIFHLNIDNPAYSGLRARQYPSSSDRIRLVTVRTALLDHVIPAGFHVDFIKIDVEGAELAVFRGARQTLSRCQPIVVFEFGRGSAEFYQNTPDDLFEFLYSVGYELQTLPGWLDGMSPFNLTQLRSEFLLNRYYNFVASPRSLRML